MKYYEFDNHPYYALIGADTVEDAIEYYETTICDIGEDEDKPTELSYTTAKNKLSEACEGNSEKIEIMEEFVKKLWDGEPYLVLLDSGLE